MRRTLLSLCFIFSGFAVFFYPFIANYLAERNQSEVIQQYEEQVAEVDEEELQEMWAEAEEYNESLAGDPVHDPFIEGSGYALPENYTEVLDVNGVMGYIEIPCIDVYLPIYHGTSEDVLKVGVGHMESTSLPIGGSNRHCVLTGHCGLPSAELFTNLDKVELGDYFYIYVLGQTLAYEVDDIRVVEPDDMSSIVAEEGEDYVTLVTCTPYGVNTHRLLVRGSRTDYVEETEEAEAGFTWPTIPRYAIGAGAGAAALLVVVIVGRRITKREKKKKD